MASADKCYFQMPYKDYLRQLQLDEEGRLTQLSLDLAADQEFQNNKATELRINDPACQATGGGCCADVFVGGGNQSGIASAVNVDVTVDSSNFTGGIEPTGFSTTLAAGAWAITAVTTVFGYSAAITGIVYGRLTPPSNTATQGGRVMGAVGLVAEATGTTHSLTSAGIIIFESPWVPHLNIYNSTNQTISIDIIAFSAHRLCSVCDFTVNQDGG